MLTHFFLHGGYTTTDTVANKTLYQEIIKIRPKNTLRVCFVLFARDQERWTDTKRGRQNFIETYTPGQSFEYRIATPETLIEDIVWADVIEVGGGSAQQLKDNISNLQTFIKSCARKVIMGSSAGAVIWAAQYAETDAPQHIGKGFGIFPYSVYPHWDTAYSVNLCEDLRIAAPNLPCIGIPERHWMYLTKDI